MNYIADNLVTLADDQHAKANAFGLNIIIILIIIIHILIIVRILNTYHKSGTQNENEIFFFILFSIHKQN